MKISKKLNISGIYTITNLIDNKIYVGHCVNFHKRSRTHKNDLRNNKHHSIHLQKAWNKYGEENFIFEILEECNKEYLTSQEHYWCNLLDVHNPKKGYNIRPTNPFGKFSISEETKQKISKANKGKLTPKGEKHHMFGKKGILNHNFGKKRSQEMIDIISKTHKGRVVSKEVRLKISIANKGYKHTDEAKAKISEVSKNISKERRKEIAKVHIGNTYNLGRITSQETKDKLSVIMKGRIVSDETRKKLSNLQKRRENINFREARKRKVYQYDLEMNFIKGFASQADAKRETNINNITGCCSGKLKTAGGFKWSYEDKR